MNKILFALAVANFVSYAWSVIGVFTKNKDQDKLRYRILQLTSIATWVICSYACFATEATDAQIAMCAAIQAICLFGFWKTTSIVKRHKFTIAFSKDTPQKLVREGLYNKVRHPFYMIYLVSYFSVGLILTDIPAIGASLVMLWVYYSAATTEEKKFLTSDLANEYQEYKKQTHMFAPKLSA